MSTLIPTLAPNPALNNLQNLLARANTAIAQNDMEAAVSALSEARLLTPEHPGVLRAYIQAHANLAAKRLKAGDAAGALRAALVALELDALHMDALVNAGSACVDLKNTSDALAFFERALKQTPFDPALKALRAHARLVHSRRLDLDNDDRAAAAIAQLDEGVAHSLRGLCLPYVYRDNTHLAEARTEYALALNRLEHAPAPLRLADLVHANFLLAYQGQNDLELQSRYGRWLCTQSARFQPVRAPVVAKRIGLLSSFWRTCTVGSYFASWITALKAAGFSVELYQLGPESDALTERLIAACDTGAVLNGTLEQIAETIAARGLDVLIYPELGMDGRTLTLASLALARVQLCAWGHPVTSGLPSIDGYFSCAAMEPENSALHYSERQILLPGLGTCYLRPTPPSARTATELGLPLGGRVLVAQSPFKLLPDNDLRMVALAHAAPTAQFVLFDTFYSGVNDAIKLRLETTFDAHDLNPERLHWQPTTDRARFLQIVRACDVALDSYAFSGGNTSLDALIMGLPLVTSPGEFMRGRQSTAMLTALGLEHCVAAADGVVDTAANFLLHREARKAYQGVLAQRLDDYLADDAPLKALVAAIAEICG